jgi:DNA-directed RNA polymerase subunit N (RpoN/RPB10)
MVAANAADDLGAIRLRNGDPMCPCVNVCKSAAWADAFVAQRVSAEVFGAHMGARMKLVTERLATQMEKEKQLGYITKRIMDVTGASEKLLVKEKSKRLKHSIEDIEAISQLLLESSENIPEIISRIVNRESFNQAIPDTSNLSNQPVPITQVNEEDLKTLKDMGFEEERCRRVLIFNNNNIDSSLNMLCTDSDANIFFNSGNALHSETQLQPVVIDMEEGDYDESEEAI